MTISNCIKVSFRGSLRVNLVCISSWGYQVPLLYIEREGPVILFEISTLVTNPVAVIPSR